MAYEQPLLKIGPDDIWTSFIFLHLWFGLLSSIKKKRNLTHKSTSGVRFTNIKTLLSYSLTKSFPIKKTMIVEKTVIVEVGESQLWWLEYQI